MQTAGGGRGGRVRGVRIPASSITGTYIETGAHMLAGAPMLNDLDASLFIRPVVVCHVPRKGPGEVIHGAELVANCPPVPPAMRC